jgi:hypothetical protein
MVFWHFLTRPRAPALDELSYAGGMLLLHVAVVVVAKCGLQGLDD